MLIVAVGVDAVEIGRIDRLFRTAGERFLQRVFTPGERAYCLARAQPAQSLAARFAAKEAVMKCLGTGWGGGVAFPSIEVVRDAAGALGVRLHGGAAGTAAARGIRSIQLSLTHTSQLALAFAVASG